jgi:alpha-1,3-rhamnosyltransferase
MSTPLVSIVIPCYNHEDFVQDSIQSVIDQTYNNIELIIIDDGSKDNCISKIQEMIDSCEQRFVRFEFRSRPNKGLSETLNEAIEWCKGEYYSAIASDDIILKDKTHIQVDFLAEHQDISAVFGSAKLIDENNKILSTILKDAELYSFEMLIMRKCMPIAPTQMIRLASIKKVGGYDPSLVIEDWYMWLKLARIGSIFCMNEVFSLYRQHDNNTSKNIVKMQQGRLDVLSHFNYSMYYRKAIANVKWHIACHDYNSGKEKKWKVILRMALLKPLTVSNLILKKLLKY